MIKNLLCKIIGHKWGLYYIVFPQGGVIGYRCIRCSTYYDLYRLILTNSIEIKDEENKVEE